MDSKLFYQYSKACHDHGTTIYPKPNNAGRYKIIINTGGKEKVGEEIYENEAYIKETILRTPQGIRKIKTVVPSVWDKIAELYKLICEKNDFIKTINN